MHIAYFLIWLFKPLWWQQMDSVLSHTAEEPSFHLAQWLTALLIQCLTTGRVSQPRTHSEQKIWIYKFINNLFPEGPDFWERFKTQPVPPVGFWKHHSCWHFQIPFWRSQWIKVPDSPDSSNSWLVILQASLMRSRFFPRVSRSEWGQLHWGKSELHSHQQSLFLHTNWPSDLQPM